MCYSLCMNTPERFHVIDGRMAAILAAGALIMSIAVDKASELDLPSFGMDFSNSGIANLDRNPDVG